MNYKAFKKAGLVLAVAALSLGSCTKNFEELNKDPYGSTDQDLEGDFAIVAAQLQQAQRSIYLFTPVPDFQVQQNLFGDIFSGYMMTPANFAGNKNNTTYFIIDGWNGTPWNVAYANVMNPSYKAGVFSKGKFDDTYAMSKLLRVEAFHRLSDLYGPIIYTKYNQPNSEGGIDFDSQKDAYYAFFADLKEAIDILTPLKDKSSSIIFTKADLVYGGKYDRWLKFANTLRLRLALRIVNIDPAKAKAEGEAALANAGGLLSTVDDNFLVSIGSTTHPLNTISDSWKDIRMGAPVESILGGYADPRLPKYFKPAIDPNPAVFGTYKGIRNGINIDDKGRYQGYSELAFFESKIQLMTTAEAWFLKSEAAIRNWAGAGSAQANYEAGIQASFEQHKLPNAAAYYNNSTLKPKPYIDPKAITAGENDIKEGSPYLSTITIKWEDAAVFETKLERILTQKWIANYPEGQEAWSEFRRTGYPKLFPVVVNASGGTVDTKKFIRRSIFPSNEYATNAAAVQKAISTLSVPKDVAGTPLWWDTK
ncbi:SusD/RagB family nutrient-binding outer membrane lipoprotein [Chitinophaga nivalis]|uniref:SusD/RagB family nutrient-binding outer membrane lipoprotein n=1 Tax=Chitinophaga nivalis TaxID=2991709 RepID=A0ABT3IFR3_9BACT|nr:SusD/RagB family nutrient-binding outer membrane lipoprotein [Chitinophaga nivalis]MCW3467515.1 SusD/RagB family nutrient-binding outer membrane lipoprotein [Chitinophaga nivalis]MCW3482793.1 SusD/RagB family nutrient-binding outer membrane lipoprotein [Chitinophaga nivalis]